MARSRRSATRRCDPSRSLSTVDLNVVLAALSSHWCAAGSSVKIGQAVLSIQVIAIVKRQLRGRGLTVMTVMSFGPFRYDLATTTLERDGQPLAVNQRGLLLIDALLEAGGMVVSKDHLLDRAWPGTVVEESNLTVQIAALRKTLGPRKDGHDWIVTGTASRLPAGPAPVRGASDQCGGRARARGGHAIRQPRRRSRRGGPHRGAGR